MTQIRFKHNIQEDDFRDRDYQSLYGQRRRDSNFSAAIEHNGKIYAFRDHLGIAPLFYRFDEGNVRFSLKLSDLVKPDDTLNREGVHAFTRLSTTRLLPLFDEIHIVPPATVVEIDPVKQTTKQIYRYELQPEAIPKMTKWDVLVDRLKTLMFTAIENQLESDTVGLYLSGGIDSALIGIFLKQLGVNINAYTSGPWGSKSSDVIYAKKNAEIIGINNHEIHCLETGDYDSALSTMPNLFGLPHGTPTGLGIVKLWENTTLPQQTQLFFGQNCDTIMACVTAQSLSYFLQPIPRTIRKRFHSAMGHTTAVENYIHLARNYDQDLSQLIIPDPPAHATALQKIITAGIYIGQTASSSEVFTQPSFVTEQSIVNPYHDMDLVEFVMGLPVMKRLSLKNDEGRWIPSMDKHLIKKLAIQYLPNEIVSRKKAFMVSFDRDDHSQHLFNSFPDEIFGIRVDKTNERFAGEILKRWLADIHLIDDELAEASNE